MVFFHHPDHSKKIDFFKAPDFQVPGCELLFKNKNGLKVFIVQKKIPIYISDTLILINRFF
jgi:hypothetical protein